jgi:predicted TIM-barrel fold metal-dependent hydrolase
MIIDSHCHLWDRGFLPPAFYRSAAEAWAKKEAGRTVDMIMPRLLEGVVDRNGDLFIANMDRAGVDISFIMMVDGGAPLFGEEPEVPLKAQIEWYSDVQRRHRGRLFMHVYPDHRRREQLDLIRYAVREHNFSGIGEITPDGFKISDAASRPAMRLAADLGVPVQVHTRSGIWVEFYGRDLSEANPCHPRHVVDLARALPDLKIILCHSGFPCWWQRAAELIADVPNCYLDISNWNEHLNKPEEIVPKLATVRSIVGAERILFASDQVSGPRFCGERSHLGQWVDFIRNLPSRGAEYGYKFTADEGAAILGGTAQRLYGLQAPTAKQRALQ